MSNDERGLQRADIQRQLPVGFDQLSKEDQQKLLEKMQQQDLEVRKEALARSLKSQNAEHDLAVMSENVARLDSDKKIYSVKQEVEMGSGKANISIRGGDTRFIVPIMVVVVLLILGVIAILALR